MRCRSVNAYDNLINIAELMLSILISNAPKATLALVGSISYEVLDDNNIIVSVGDDQVDYAYYTNEIWFHLLI